MADSKKTATLNRVMEEGYTSGYGTLLHLTASMGPEPKRLEPDSTLELAAWRGHFEGLRAALLCLAMAERQLVPEVAALVVNQHLERAMNDLEQGDETGTEE